MLLLNNEEVEKAPSRQKKRLLATEAIYRELAEGQAVNRTTQPDLFPTRIQGASRVSVPDEDAGRQRRVSGVWALRITSDMAGFDFTAGVKRRRILRAATGNKWCGLIDAV